MFDVFYIGTKPNLFAHERECTSIEHAQELSSTRFFWIVNYLTDYTHWDFLWEPVPWQGHQRHAWPSQHQKDSGTYLVPKQGYTETNYHTDRRLTRCLAEPYWTQPDNIDQFDYTWHPDPTEPAYIYEFPTTWNNRGGPVYTVPGAIDYKYPQQPVAALTRHPDKFNLLVPGVEFDYSWTPHPQDPPYIYVFGNQWHRAEIMPTVEYRVSGATERKFVPYPKATLPEQHNNRWHTLKDCAIDYSWVPDPGDPPYI